MATNNKMKTGPGNQITDVAGIQVGHAQDLEIMTGTTVILPDEAAVAAVDCRGGGPGTRETDALNSANLVDSVHAIVLSCGSAMGLDAASGVAAWLLEQKRGFQVAKNVVVPIVPAAILFDLMYGGNKSKVHERSYFDFGKLAAASSSTECPMGNVGAGTGAKAGTLKGGIGTASLCFAPDDDKENMITVGALTAVNPFGSVVYPRESDSDPKHFWAWPYERNQEYGGWGALENQSELSLDFDFESPFRILDETSRSSEKSNPVTTNTTLSVVATDVALNKSQAKRVAIMAQDGFARAIRPVHTPFDGDTVFVLSTGKNPLSANPAVDLARLGMMAADCVARSIARGVYEAQSLGRWKSFRDS